MTEDEIEIECEIEFNACAGCTHMLVEEVEYDYYVAMDGSAIAIPKGCPPPAIICTRDMPALRSATFPKECPYRKGGEE